MVAFLALFVLLHVPGVALSAAGALAPDRLHSSRRASAAIGVTVGARPRRQRACRSATSSASPPVSSSCSAPPRRPPG